MNILRKKYLSGFLTIFMIMVTIWSNIFQYNVVLADTQIPDFKKNELMVNGKDYESIVFLIVGDGFQENEQELFNEKAEELMTYIINTSPFGEMKEYMNFYSLNVISNESGAADNTSELKDTYFQSSYNYMYNIERLLAPTNWGAAFELAYYYVPDFDYILMIINDERYGGSGGAIPTTSIHDASYEIMMHEMGHTIGNLADEYWAGSQYAREASNMTKEDDPLKVPWSDLVNKNGIGVYPYEENPTWFRPSTNCKMQYLGKDYPFCDVCTRVLKSSLEDSRWQTNSIQSYNDLLVEIKVSPIKKTLHVGDTKENTTTIKLKLPAILHRVNKFTKTEIDIDHMEVMFKFKSKNPKVAKVSKSGKITAKKKGNTQIVVTAMLADGTSTDFEISVKVLDHGHGA